MKICRLYIGDFGIYRNSLMENISPKIVVIGGLNRSGKTTFLDIMRNLPFGFSKNLRPSSVEYYLECDLKDENNNELSIRINGLREPQVSFKNESRKYTEKLYEDMDKFTYSQLYTITLDELKKLNNKNDEEKLQAILLGAGISDIVHVPKLIENIRKDKEKIGGKNGNPKAKLFKPYYEKILDGVNNRDEALEQVEIFKSKETEAQKMNEDIIEINDEISSLKERRLVFELLDNNFEEYLVYNKLKSELAVIDEKKLYFDFNSLPYIENVEALYEEYCEANSYYNRVLDNYNGIIKDKNNRIELIRYEDKIRYFVKNISGLKQKLLEQAALKKDFEVLKETVLKRMGNINRNPHEGYEQVLNIDSDLINEDKLVKLAEDLRYTNEQKKSCIEELEATKEQIEAFTKDLRPLKNNEFGKFFKSYLFISLCILSGSIFIYFLNKTIGAGLFITGITSAALYFFVRQVQENQINNNVMNLKLQMKAAENKETLYVKKLENYNSKEVDLRSSFNLIKEKLRIHEDVSENGLLQYFKEIRELKNNVISLNNIKDKIEKSNYYLNLELNEMHALASKFIKLYEPKMEDISIYSEEIFQCFEIVQKELENAKLQTNAEEKLLIIKEKLKEKLILREYNKPLDIIVPELIEQYKVYNIKNELNSKLQAIEKNILKNLSSERINSAFKTVGKLYNIDKNETIEYFYSMLNLYPVRIEIQNEIEVLENKLKETAIKLDDLKERLQIIKLELNNLSTSSKLLEAQRLLDEGRLNLKPLAVKYSVLSSAEYILEEVQKEFLDNAKHRLLYGAGEMFSKITSGKYKEVLPGDNLLQTDFKTVGAEGKIEESTSMLSRGTAEQLFLSVRLNRIKAIKQKLPIIFDDPFVNFDEEHVKNTIMLITELAEENQIFILTCHGELIKQIEAIESDVQYWKLNKGRFELSNSEELINHLTKI